jgi:RNase P subunit RPR2
MKYKISKKQAEEKIKEFFENIKNKTPKEVKKIKRLAANKKIPLKEKRQLFCKKCLTPYSGKEKIRIKSEKKSVVCLNCGYISRWKINSS